MNKNKVITYVQYLFRFILGGLLVFAGILKMQDNSALFESVAYITWLPIGLKSLIIDLLPYVEVLVGGLLALSLFSKIVDPIATIIYLIFFIFAIYGLTQGIEGDCGCFGELGESTLIGSLLGSQFGWKMVIRNGFFVLMAAFLFWKPSAKVNP
ncbi:MauE/DoxX family redox-associated membrane protein [Rhodohalobacter sp. 614A]|uniref:MauE/DoxX family redox-associated membrane protein n=1 Tax=Rhodohalobacter sp. 614A TaxID=2908649 RepID=UPI001F246E88|nr:MauE/DoxX family redox-associated membrane protein [Rhodohalobacter sp. 614A]